MLSEVYQYFISLPLLELLAVATALLYVVLAAKQNILCWPAALISTVLYTVIFYDVYLWMDSLLQIYYFVMAGYGWYCWQGSKRSATQSPTHSSTPILQWTLAQHVKWCISLVFISLGLGYLMANYTPTHFPYLDSLTTVFAVFATYLVTQKVLENWLYWIVIDFVSIYLYIEKSLTPTAFLFAIYVVIAFIGYLAWQRDFKNQKLTGELCGELR